MWLRSWERDTGWVLHMQNAISACCSAGWMFRISEGWVPQNEMKKKMASSSRLFITNSNPGVICLSPFYNYALKQKYFFYLKIQPRRIKLMTRELIQRSTERNSLKGNRLMTSVKALNIYLQSNNVSLWSFSFQPNATDFSRSLKKKINFFFHSDW